MFISINSVFGGLQSYDRWYLFFGILSFLPLFAYHEYNFKGTKLEDSLRDGNVRLIFAIPSFVGGKSRSPLYVLPQRISVLLVSIMIGSSGALLHQLYSHAFL